MPIKRELTDILLKYINTLESQENLMEKKNRKKKLEKISDEILKIIKDQNVKKLFEQVKTLKENGIYDLYNEFKKSKD